MAVQHQNRTHAQPLSVNLRLKPLTVLLLAAWDEANRGHSDPLVLLNLYNKTWKGMRWPLEKKKVHVRNASETFGKYSFRKQQVPDWKVLEQNMPEQQACTEYHG